MMNLGGLSARPRRWVGTRFVAAYLAGIDRGELWSMPFHLWSRLPRPVRHWMEWRLLAAGEEHAQRLLDESHPLRALRMPPSDGWSLAATARFALHGLAARASPLNLVELGSGLSTLILAHYARSSREQGRPTPRICSIDHDEGWLDRTRSRLAEHGLASFVTTIHAPLGPRHINGGEAVTYCPDEALLAGAAGPSGFDFCLIDGPPATVGRGPCLPLLAPWLAPRALVLLDDAYREGEQAIWRSWTREPTGMLRGSRLYLTSRGLAVGRWEPNSDSPPPGRRGSRA